jgi:UDP-2,3-diacylglucosamine hydrolase
MAQVVFLSDAHLGSGPDSLQREKELCSFLDGIKDDCRMLFLLGDMFDFWFTYRHTVPRGHTRLLGKLAELSDRGVELHFFIGNHDMWMFDYLEKEMGAVMHDEPEVMEIDGRRFLIGHGDGLGHLDHSYDFLRRIFRSRLNQWLFALLPPSWTFPFARRWSDNNKLKHARKNTLHYLGDDREGIVLYCKQRMEKEHFDYCVFGHRHTPLVKVLSEQCSVLSNATQSGGSPLNTEHLTLNTIYVNTGDWMINRNYAVYSLGDHTLRLYDLNGGEVINQQK